MRETRGLRGTGSLDLRAPTADLPAVDGGGARATPLTSSDAAAASDVGLTGEGMTTSRGLLKIFPGVVVFWGDCVGLFVIWASVDVRLNGETEDRARTDVRVLARELAVGAYRRENTEL